MHLSKIRGQKRKQNTLLKNIDSFVPFTGTQCQYEHFHVPGSPWIQMPKTSGRVKTEFCKKWIAKTEEFIFQKPERLPFCKVVAALSYPNLWDSQIIIFYDKVYFDSFWDRKGPYQVWKRMNNTESFVKERGIITDLPETGYIEELIDDDYRSKSFIWFYGEQL